MHKDISMRIWLVADSHDGERGGLQSTLKQCVEHAGEGHVLVGCQPAGPCLAREVRAQQVDALVIPDGAWPDTAILPELLETGVSILVATTAVQCERYMALAQV